MVATVTAVAAVVGVARVEREVGRVHLVRVRDRLGGRVLLGAVRAAPAQPNGRLRARHLVKLEHKDAGHHPAVSQAPSRAHDVE